MVVRFPMKPCHAQITNVTFQNPSYIGAIIAAVVQVGALISYIAAYFPGGIQTLKFAGQMAMRGAGSILPV